MSRFSDDVANTQPLFKSLAVFSNGGHDKTFGVFCQTKLVTKLIRHARNGQAKKVCGCRRFLAVHRCWHGTFAFFATPERNPQCLCFTVAENQNPDFGANRRIGHLLHKAARIIDLDPVKAEDDITGFHTRFTRRTFWNVGHQSAACLFQSKAVGQIIGDVLNSHAQPAAPRFAKFLQLLDHVLSHPARHCKSDADGPTIGTKNRCVYSDDFAFHVEKRTARVSPVNCRVGLNVIVIGSRERAATSRHDTGRHRKALTKWVAHRHDPITDAGEFTVSPRHEGQRLVAYDFQQCEVGVWVCANKFGFQLETLKEFDQDFISPLNHMIVGNDEAILRDHES